MTSRFRLPIRPLPSSVPIWMLVTGLLATVGAASYLEQTARAKDEIRFDGAVQHVRANIGNRVDTYTALLRAGAGLFAANSVVDANQFHEFAARLDLRDRYPGMQGIGFAIRVTRDRLPALLAQVRAAGRPEFRVWPDDPRDVYYPILYIEPQDRRNTAAVGYDMFTEPVRRAAMQAAARTGSAAGTGRVTLVQEIDPQKQAGFLIYAPVYESAEDRGGESSALRGFIYGPFRAGDFLSSALAGETANVSVAVYDGVEDDHQLLFHSHPDSDLLSSSRFTRAVRMNVAGRPWLVRVHSLPAFEYSGDARLLPWVLGIGLLVTFALTIATWREVRARAAAEATAERLRRSEEALRDGEAKLRLLVEAERQAHAEAAAANRAKDSFLATLSHELRTPLNAILGWVAMLKSGRLAEKQRARAVDVIARSARTQADLIEDLLDVSRIITGKMAVEMRPMRLSPPLAAAIDAVRPAAEARQIRLERHLDADPPVLGDPDRLQQVAWNLLSNAIKFTPVGGVVTVSLEQQERQVELRVTDTGIGISPSFLPYVFDRFRQHDSSTTRAHGGMGLGLAIAKHLVEAHGGVIHAESRGEGHGATFVVRLPVHVEAVPASAPGALARRPAARPDSGLQGLRVLLVDDDPDALEMMAQVLASEGARTITANSAERALDVLHRDEVDIILADIGMPGTDGYQLMRTVRQHSSAGVRAVPAIAVTAYAGERDREAALAAGFQEHIVKPVDLHELRGAVRRLLTTQ